MWSCKWDIFLNRSTAYTNVSNANACVNHPLGSIDMSTHLHFVFNGHLNKFIFLANFRRSERERERVQTKRENKTKEEEDELNCKNAESLKVASLSNLNFNEKIFNWRLREIWKFGVKNENWKFLQKLRILSTRRLDTFLRPPRCSRPTWPDPPDLIFGQMYHIETQQVGTTW